MRGPAFARCLASAHHGLAHLAHHRANVGKVEIDLAGLDHQIGDTGNALVQHGVGDVERIGKGGPLIRQPEQVLVRNDDQRVDIGLHLFDAGFGLCHPALTFKVKRLGDHADSQDAAFAGSARDNRGSPGTCATTHAGGYEHHVAVGKFTHHRFDTFLGGGASNIWLRSGTKALGYGRTKLDLATGK